MSPRQFLMEELERRCRQNTRYSMRAFARTLGLTPAALSMMLSGKRRVTKKTAIKITAKLGLNPFKSKALLEGCLKSYSIEEPTDFSNYSSISLDNFSIISEWYHFGILSLIETKDFQPKMPWIASRLGISLAEAKAAVERLVRLGILNLDQPRWKQIGNPILVENTESTAATRQFQNQVIQKAKDSLESDPMEVRDMTSMTMAIDPELLPLAKKEIQKFRVYLMNLLEKKSIPKEVYHLAVQIYPLSRK